MENDQKAGPYDAAIADVQQRIKQLENTLVILQQLKAGGLPGVDIVAASGSASGVGSGHGVAPATGPGAFLGMTIHDAAKKLLASQRRQMQTTEIVAELERGGVVLTSADKVNTVGSVLLRRFQNVGDIVRVSRGLWGLQEWYPGRKFHNGKTKGDTAEKAEAPSLSEVMDVGNETTTPEGPRPGLAPWMKHEEGGDSA